jgi:hypothetical protein
VKHCYKFPIKNGFPAKEAFKFLGKKLKKLRIDDDMEDLMAYLPETGGEDPADKVRTMIRTYVDKSITI